MIPLFMSPRVCGYSRGYWLDKALARDETRLEK
jgi:hypothetical protein